MEQGQAALYLRLSRDDDRAGESGSIENQRAYLEQFVCAQGWQVGKVYVDDGWSGTSFQRPGFQALLRDVEAGEVRLVLTKDLSRLGRDQMGTAYYYQVYFPERRVRYIAVAEGLDTGKRGSESLLFPFLTAANEFYTADVSRKVRAALLARKRAGQFIGAQPPLGYGRDPADRGKLRPDPAGARVVRAVFREFLACGSVAGTARRLTQAGWPTPARFRAGETGGSWRDTTVRRILTNPTYVGDLTQNRREKVSYRSQRRVDLPREAWITVERTHEGLIPRAVFDRAAQLLAGTCTGGEKGIQ